MFLLLFQHRPTPIFFRAPTPEITADTDTSYGYRHRHLPQVPTPVSISVVPWSGRQGLTLAQSPDREGTTILAAGGRQPSQNAYDFSGKNQCIELCNAKVYIAFIKLHCFPKAQGTTDRSVYFSRFLICNLILTKS